MKKNKENIRNQILKRLEYFRSSKGITFFDDTNTKLKESIDLETNELEVLLIRVNRLKRILLTTKHIFVIDNKSTHRISSKDIDRFDYMEFINGEKIIEGKSKIKKIALRFKMNYRVGNYRIIEKNGSHTEITIWRTHIADCLNDSIKKLKFVGNKYEAI